MTASMIDRLTHLIAARCPELTPSDLALVEAALDSDDVAVLVDVADRIEDALMAMANRMDKIDERLDRIEEAA